MPLVSMRQLLDHAAEHGYALPAFNVNNMEQIHAILGAARDAGSPAILAVSAGGRRYAGEPIMRHMLLGAREMYPEIPIATHQAFRSRRSSWGSGMASERSTSIPTCASR